MALDMGATMAGLNTVRSCHHLPDSRRSQLRSSLQPSSNLSRRGSPWPSLARCPLRHRLQCFAISEPRKAETDPEVSGSTPEASAQVPDPKQALKALDQQLSQLASSEDKPRQRAAGTAAKPTSASDLITDTPNFRRDPYPQNKAPPQFGRESSGEGWPEFDMTFFTYSCLVLLVITALTNVVYYKLVPRTQDGDLTSEAAVAAKEKKDERAAKLSALYKQAIGDSPAAMEYEQDAVKTAPSLEME